MAGPFPTSPNNGDLHTTDGGTVYEFKTDHDRWTLYKADVDLDDLSNVNSAGKDEGDVLVWDVSEDEWVPGEAGVGTHRLDEHDAPNTSVAMGSQKFTGIANGTSGTDSMAFGQKYTNANAISAVQGEATLTLGAQVSIDGSGWLEAGNSPSGTTNLEYNGYFWATRTYNAVYNDYADFWYKSNVAFEKAGECYSFDSDGNLTNTRTRNDKNFAGIYTDTYGHGMGTGIPNRIPLSIAGFVLAYTDKVYKSGTELTTNNKGTLTKKRFWEKTRAVFVKVEYEKVWKDIEVDGRCWVMVK